MKNKRVEKAAKLLLAFVNRITDIAVECGSNDIAHFTNGFHDKYNVAQTNYRINQSVK